MKQITPFDIFSVFHNAKLICKNGKDIPLNNSVFYGIYERTKDVFKAKYKKLWNEYENSFFTIDQLKLYVLYEYLFRTNVSVINIDSNEIPNVDKFFSERQLEIDKELLLSVKENHNLKRMKSLFEITEDGESVAYNLTKKKLLSPMVYINCIDKLNEENTNKEYIRFKRIILLIKNELNKNKGK